MKVARLFPASLSAVVLASAFSAKAEYPLPGTLPNEENIIMTCSVDSALMAKDCSSRPGAPAAPLTKRENAFIQVETSAPDFLTGATPGALVQVMIRRSTSSTLDASNPGRAVMPASPMPPITDPDLATVPSPASTGGYFPDRALRMNFSGDATVRCTVGDKGDLLGCWVVNGHPAARDFGFAALHLSTLVKLRPTMKDGSPTAGRSCDLHAAFDVRSGQIALSIQARS